MSQPNELDVGNEIDLAKEYAKTYIQKQKSDKLKKE